MSTNTQSTDNRPLPCRGCTANCPNRDKCQGKPWRKE